jgi:hypothetical protein
MIDSKMIASYISSGIYYSSLGLGPGILLINIFL